MTQIGYSVTQIILSTNILSTIIFDDISCCNLYKRVSFCSIIVYLIIVTHTRDSSVSRENESFDTPILYPYRRRDFCAILFQASNWSILDGNIYS